MVSKTMHVSVFDGVPNRLGVKYSEKVNYKIQIQDVFQIQIQILLYFDLSLFITKVTQVTQQSQHISYSNHQLLFFVYDTYSS